MRLRGITLREIRMPLLVPFETSMERTAVRRILLVEANVDGTTGWGECVAGETPSYGPETTETAWYVLGEFIWPRMKGTEFFSAADVWAMLEGVRGHETAICLDECIHTEEQARAAIELGACRIINIKVGRVGGHTVARRIHDLCQANGMPVWCGGMLEAGIGRAHNIALSTLPNFTLPGDVAASKGYWAEDIIEPEVVVSPRGTIAMSAVPGDGFPPGVARIGRVRGARE